MDLLKGWVQKNMDEIKRFANFSSLYAGLVDENGCPNMYDGKLRVMNSSRKILAEFDPANYLEYIGEHVEPWSYLKFPFFKPMGYPEGCYRVGPLGRVNAADGMSTPRADEELKKYRQAFDSSLMGCTLLYHYTRLIELLNCLEKAEALLKDDRICDKDVRITTDPAREEGVGVIEAPRGILIHHYWVDGYGSIKKANLIVATGHNNIAMNRSVQLVAKEYIRSGNLKEGMLNRVEGAIRCYDPCLSCGTHALGQMPLKIEIKTFSGELLYLLQRD
jgi:NAD-reducing hydrogenase large subunit